MLKIRRSWGRLIFKMEIPILVRPHLYIETPPWPRCNTLRPRQNGRNYADDVLIRIFLNESIWMYQVWKIPLKFVPKGPVNNIPALVQIMAWSRPGGKQLSEPIMLNLLRRVCVSRPQWVNTLRPRQNGRHFADDILNCILLNENVWIPNKISLKFVPKGRINNIPSLVQIWTNDG